MSRKERGNNRVLQTVGLNMHLPKWPLLAAISICACASGPDQVVAGIWTVDSTATKLPQLPFPGAERQMERAFSSILLKLRTDHTFTLVTVGTIDGTWKVDGDKLLLQPKAAQHPIKLSYNSGEQRLVIEQKTPIGDAGLILRKSG